MLPFEDVIMNKPFLSWFKWLILAIFPFTWSIIKSDQSHNMALQDLNDLSNNNFIV